METWLDSIQRCFRSDGVLYTRHAREEMKQEEFGRILEQEVHEAVLCGEVIEEYPDDEPYPSRLIYGQTRSSRPLHVLCAYEPDDQMAIVITVYQPDPSKWIDWQRRRKS